MMSSRIGLKQEQVIELVNKLHGTLKEMNSPPSNADADPEKLYVLSILKFGRATVDRFVELLDKIPHIWSDDVQLYILRKQWTGTPSVDVLLRWIVPWYNTKPVTSEQSMYLGPPTGSCYSCGKELKVHNPPTNVRYATSTGVILQKKKITLRCPCRINYRFEMYGTREGGYRFYDTPRDAVVAVDTVFIDRKVYSLQWAFSQHAWVSAEGFSESWHEAFEHTKDEAIDRRVWIKSFWWGELEEELHRLHSIGTICDIGYRFHHKDKDMDKCMAYVDSIRSRSPYPHPEESCSPQCRIRGCGKLWVTDGLWKIRFAHCMFYVKNEVGNTELLNYPSVCSNEPLPGKAFCSFHCEFINDTNPQIPTTLRGFLEYEGIDSSDDEDNISDREDMPGTSEHTASTLPSEEHTAVKDMAITEDEDGIASSKEEESAHPSGGVHFDQATSPLSEQSGQQFLQENVECLQGILSKCDEEHLDDQEPRCNKDLGKRSTLRRMSRGVQVVVRAGGHIDMWTPLYVSESNGQVMLFIITWLYETLQIHNIPPTEWQRIVLCYDNMCQLVRMRVSREPLQLPKPYDEMWLKITKCIDTLHVRNHVMEQCKTELHPDRIGEIHPDLKESKNTQAAEQTFVYLSRHWRVMNSMSKTHNLFYLHRLCIRRNAYIAKCNKVGKRPLLPSRKKKHIASSQQ